MLGYPQAARQTEKEWPSMFPFSESHFILEMKEHWPVPLSSFSGMANRPRCLQFLACTPPSLRGDNKREKRETFQPCKVADPPSFLKWLADLTEIRP